MSTLPVLYATTKKDYTKGKTVVVNVNTEKLNARHDMESYVVGFILSKDGETTDMSGKVLEKKDFLRSRDSLNEGHYIVMNSAPDRDNTKMSVWKRYVETTKTPGLLWGESTRTTLKWCKVMAVFITDFQASDYVAPSAPSSAWSQSRRTRVRANQPENNDNAVVTALRKTFISRLQECEFMGFIREYYVARARAVDTTDTVETLTIGALRTKFRSEFTKCPFVNRKRVVMKSFDNKENQHAQLCASILDRCAQIRQEIDAEPAADVESTETAESVESVESVEE
jgi:hypothetical protein